MSWEIRQGDVLEELRTLIDEGRRFDCVATDPPYCSGGNTSAERSQSVRIKYYGNRTTAGNNWKFNDLLFSDSMDLNALYDFTRRWLRLSWQLLLPPGYIFIFCDWRQIGTFANVLQSAGFGFRGVFPWNKKNARPNKGQFTQCCEFVVYGTKEGKSCQHAKGIIECPPPPTDQRIHPTEKPPEVFAHLYKILPPTAHSVLDPFCGSAASGVAALSHNLDYVGIDIVDGFVQQSRLRMEREASFPTLPFVDRNNYTAQVGTWKNRKKKNSTEIENEEETEETQEEAFLCTQTLLHL